MTVALTGALLRELAAVGPFFALQTHAIDSRPREPWHPMSELVRDPNTLINRVAAVRAGLAAGSGREPEAVEFRVAASVTHLGLVARLVSPVLALATISATVLEIDLDTTRWQRQLGGAFPLSVPPDTADGGEHRTPERLASLLARHLLGGPVQELGAATGALSVSHHVVQGNVASAIHGAAALVAASRPLRAGHARAIATCLLDQPPLRGSSTISASQAFRRRSCCLIYRAAPGAAGPVCGDCVLSRDPTTLDRRRGNTAPIGG
ncbi:MAG TPA: (2Fe-2S)-binding protein [Pseudonocardiaceae bacterium]|jgi:ferric iron reductase protein FhuF